MTLWAMMYPLIKLIEGEISPIILSFFRFSFATVVLAPFVRLSQEQIVITKEHLKTLILASIILAATMPLLIFGVARSTTINGAILLNTNPLWIAVLAFIIGVEKVNLKKILAIITGIIGVAFVSLNGQGLDTVLKSEYFTGSLALIVGALLIAVFALYSKKYVPLLGSLYFTFITLFIASLIMFIAIVISGNIDGFFGLSFKTVIVSFLIGTVSTAIPFLIFANSLKKIDTSIVASFKLLIPVFATLYSFMLFDEPITIWIILGMVLTSIGIYFVQR